MRWWFDKNPRLLNPTDGIKIQTTINSSIDGAFEALMRAPHMLAKTFGYKLTDEHRMMRVAKGLVIEKTVSHWFQRKWPNMYVNPENDRLWTTPCDHDFKLSIKNMIIKIDVVGENYRGEFSNPGYGKRAVDMHLLCKPRNTHVLWKSAIKGSNHNGTIFPEGFDNIDPHQIVVWLNCMKAGLNFNQISDMVNK